MIGYAKYFHNNETVSLKVIDKMQNKYKKAKKYMEIKWIRIFKVKKYQRKMYDTNVCHWLW